MQFNQLLANIETYKAQKIYFAIGDQKTSTTFGSLHNDIKTIVIELEKLGIPPRACVGVLGDNSYSWLVWSVALVVAGYIPVFISEEDFLETSYEIISKYQLHLLISDRHDIDTENSVLNISAHNQLPNSVTIQSGQIIEDPDVLCLVFSSGTTGHLKGLIISKTGTQEIIKQFAEAFSISKNDHYFSFLPFSYFQQTALNFCALYYGVAISVVSSDNVSSELTKQSPTYIIAPPVFHEAIYKSAKMIEKVTNNNSIAQILGGNMRFMITAMAPISKEIIEYYWEGGVKVYETYAVTETGMATWNTPQSYRIGTVGKEAEENTLSISENGELLIKRQKPVSLGYFNTGHDISSETFLPDGSVATGDIVKKDLDGFYHIIGRKKHAIITPEGKKFHPEELEASLKAKIPSLVPLIYLDEVTKHITALLFCESPSKDIIVNSIGKTIKETNKFVSSHKRILTVFLSDKVPTYENGFLTRNLKINRKNIQKAIADNSLEITQITI